MPSNKSTMQNLYAYTTIELHIQEHSDDLRKCSQSNCMGYTKTNFLHVHLVSRCLRAPRAQLIESKDRGIHVKRFGSVQLRYSSGDFSEVFGKACDAELAGDRYNHPECVKFGGSSITKAFLDLAPSQGWETV